ncbi:MAG: hypothetical protein RL600_68, partial [Actinomycetota bacterium]
MSEENLKALSRLAALVSDGYPFAALQARVRNPRVDVVAPQGAHSTVLEVINQFRGDAKLAQVQLVVVATGREAEDVAAALRSLSPQAEILEFPSWETLPHERLSPSPETVGKRLRVLHRLNEISTLVQNKKLDHSVFVLASVRAVLQPVVAGLANHPPLKLERGKDYLLFEMSLKLAEHAMRLEFFGDELDDIRVFSVADQRTITGEEAGSKIDAIEIYPAREIIITPNVASRAREMMHEFPNISTMLAKISEGIPVDGMESLAPVLVDAMVPFTDYLPEGAVAVLLSPEKSAARAANLVETNEEFLHAAWDAAVEGAQAPLDLSDGGFIDLSQFKDGLAGRALITVSQFGADDDSLVDLKLYEIPNFKGLDTTSIEWLEDQAKQGQQVIVVAEGHGTVERLNEQLNAAGINAQVAQGNLRKGFTAPDSKVIVITESEFYGKSSVYVSPQVRKLASKRGQAVDPLSLKQGDYVVHETHGIGRFVELVERTSGVGRQQHQREYLLIEYAPSKRGYPGDTLFVPTDQLDLLTRYVGGEAPVLSKMGGSDWAKVKGNARKAIRKIAIDLVKLYSARMKSRGHAFGPDTPWQHELEEAFAFAETPDQLTTIDEVKRDMEKEIPMDRLFKAIQDGKQVAMLVPTTLLVRQHTDTFEARYAGFPVVVRSLSRFQSAKEVKETLEGLENGSVDLVIGTHRLLSKNVKFRQLGLVIIDEEQRFGVEHKEKLKELKTNVDILSMSATPIPRTLEMAITGIREMSTLATPPEERHPILTYIGGYSEKQVAAAIRRELIREGQVFFVHNRVSTIGLVANQLAELVPEARIAVAHGQM